MTEESLTRVVIVYAAHLSARPDASMVEAARFLATNPKARADGMAISAEFAAADSEALDLAEQGEAEAQQWWK